MINSTNKVNKAVRMETEVVERSTSDVSPIIVAPKIAKWFNNFDCAVSFRFDDNLKSHVEFVIPQLNKYDYKATFMINPGRNYKKYKDFWENQMPKMGHRWGNHTWHHRGAQNLGEAEFEIGEVSKLIWKLYPGESKLNVFASGGGEEWGGRRWHKTFPEYREIPKRYNLIDLYDGKHKGFELNSGISQSEIEKRIDDTIREKKHQAFIFHKVGNKNILDHLRKIIKNFNYTFDEDQLLQLIQYLNSNKNQIWIAPLVQIYKYEEEFKSAELKILNKDEREIILKLKINTDPNLYDQELTLLLPRMNNKYPTGVLQNTKHLEVVKSKSKEYCSYIKPLSCEIQVMYD